MAWAAAALGTLHCMQLLHDRLCYASSPPHALLHSCLAARLQMVRQIAAGWQHSVALVEGGAVYSWGSGAAGALGLGDMADQDVPCRSVACMACELPLSSILLLWPQVHSAANGTPQLTCTAVEEGTMAW